MQTALTLNLQGKCEQRQDYSIIREKIQSRFGASFAQPDFSCDNAAGVAILAGEAAYE